MDVVFTNADGQSFIFTNGFTYVASLGTAPAIVTQPANLGVASRTTVMLSVMAAGTEPFDYQWQFRGANLMDDGHITGSQSNLLVIATALPGDAGQYQAVVSNAFGSTAGVAATLTVVAPPVFLSVAKTGGAVTFTWSTMVGQTYQAQFATSLDRSSWAPFSTLTATNATATASDATHSDTQRFYRILWLAR